MSHFSIKMRASLENNHISGAERVVEKEKIQDVLKDIYEKISHKQFDNINIKIELIKDIFFIDKPLEIKDYKFNSPIEANNFAVKILSKETGIKKECIEELINIIHTGASENKDNMRGAMIVNKNCERLEKDKNRGVRTTNVDFSDREKFKEFLYKKGYTERTLDALAIATKNLNYPDILAEYCISDEPDYITGYIAIKNQYIRITPLKKDGNPKGGRIYFVKNNTDIEDLYDYLQNKTFLIKV